MRLFPAAGMAILLLACLNSPLPADETSQTPFTPESPINALQNYEPTIPQETSVAVPQETTQAASSSQDRYPCEGNVNCRYKLNVRSGPWGKIIDGILPGSRIEIIAREGDWYRIRHGSGFAYVHTHLVDAPGAPALDGPNSSPYSSGPSAQPTPGSSPTTTSPAPSAVPAIPSTAGATTQTATGGINGPAIPAVLLSGLEAAKKSEWLRSHKCLQFAGTIAAEAGATQGNARASQPQAAYPADTRLRGTQINKLPQAVEAGILKPGMLIHVKIHYDKDPAYHVSDDAHHWFVYMGKNKNGVPMFADNTHKGNLQTADEVYSNMRGWENSKKYGDAKYGYVPRITAIHDPFADKR